MGRKYLFVILIILFTFDIFVAEIAKEVTWTIRRDTSLLWDVVNPENADYYKLKTIPRGSKVFPVAHKTKDYFKVKLTDGEFGYVNYLDINHAYWVTNKEYMKAYKGEIFKSDYDILPPNTKAYVMKVLSDDVYNIRIKDGRIRNVHRSKMYSPYFDSLPEVSQNHYRIYTYANLTKMMRNKDISQAYKKLGNADALIFRDDSLKTAEVYFGYIIVVKDKMRFKGIKLITEDNKVKDIEVLGIPRTSIVEKLPLASLIHNLGLNNIFHAREKYLQAENTKTIMNLFTNRNRYLNFWGKILFLIFLFLISAIPQVLTWPLRNQVNKIKTLGNKGVIIINFLILSLVVYLFFLILNIYVFQEQFVFIFILTLFPWLIFNLLNSRKVLNYRCPQCKTMWKKPKEIKSTPPKIKNKKKAFDKKKKEQRKCKECGYNWDENKDKSDSEK